MYNDGVIFAQPSLEYEFTTDYAHILITGQATEPEKLFDKFKSKIEEIKQNGIDKDDFERTKKMIYGGYVKEYNDVADIARMFLSDSFKGINSFDYIEEIGSINIEYGEQILDNVFVENKMVLSTVKK